MLELVVDILRDVQFLELKYTTVEVFKTVAEFISQILAQIANILPK